MKILTERTAGMLNIYDLFYNKGLMNFGELLWILNQHYKLRQWRQSPTVAMTSPCRLDILARSLMQNLLWRRVAPQKVTT